MTTVKARPCLTAVVLLTRCSAMILATQQPHAAVPPAASPQMATLCGAIPGATAGTYLVTMAATHPEDQMQIVSTFASAVVVNITTEQVQHGAPTVCLPWDGLDENLMPVPPGHYGVKGIASRAELWAKDGRYHAIYPEYAGAALPFAPSIKNDSVYFHVVGDPCGSSMATLAVDSATSTAVFYHAYLENAYNNFRVNLSLPNGWDQCTGRYDSGGKGGGNATTTDGDVIWSLSDNGGLTPASFIYRADGSPWGTGSGRWTKNVYQPKGLTVSMDHTRTTKLHTAGDGGTTVVLVAQTKQTYLPGSMDSVVFIDGYDSKASELATVTIDRPVSISVRDGWLYALHAVRTVSKLQLSDGLPTSNPSWIKLFDIAHVDVPTPFAMSVGSGGKAMYVSDVWSNCVAKLDGSSGKKLLYFGDSNEEPAPGTYSSNRLMGPTNLAVWVEQDTDHVLVLETRGPSRIAQWDASGKLEREWVTPQTQASQSGGWAVDDENPSEAYVLASRNPYSTLPSWTVPSPFAGDPWNAYSPLYVNRFKIHYDTGEFEADAVYPNISTLVFGAALGNPRVVRPEAGGTFLAFQKGFAVYRFQAAVGDGQAGESLVPSAGIVSNRSTNGIVTTWVFRDANGNGLVEAGEWNNSPIDMPGGCPGYFGDTVAEDLALLCVGRNGSADIWRLPVEKFDEHGNPAYSRIWVKEIEDPCMAAAMKARAANTSAPPLLGGNEDDDADGFAYGSAWSTVLGNPQDGYFVDARSGFSFNADWGAQQKITRYVPGADGKMRMQWRVGRASLHAESCDSVGDWSYLNKCQTTKGQMVGSIRMSPPHLGMFGVVDNSRSGLHVFTSDGLFVDTCFLDGQYEGSSLYGLPGEFWAGKTYYNKDDGHVYAQMGKQSMTLYRMRNWSRNTTVALAMQNGSSFQLSAKQISPPNMVALQLRGQDPAGAMAKTVHIRRAAHPPSLDGSLTGWETAANISFWTDEDHFVLAHLLHDTDTIYLRAQLTLGQALQPTKLPTVWERLFTHGVGATTLSFYLQANVSQAPVYGADAREGNARIVLGLFDTDSGQKAVAMGMYPFWRNADGSVRKDGHSFTYGTKTQGDLLFENVMLLNSTAAGLGVKTGFMLEADGTVLVLTAAIDRHALPPLGPLSAELNTSFDVSTTMGGHTKMWWACRQFGCSTLTYDEHAEAKVYAAGWGQAVFE